MAIDARIPLGVQPVQQQQNMLGQYAQIMAIKAAQQEMQGSEDMRNLFAGGANFDDPEFQRKGYMANAKGFQELLSKRATTQKTELEAIAKEIELRRDALVNARTPEDYLKWHEGNHTGKAGAFLKSIGMTPSRESIMVELSKPGGLEKLKTESALGATRLAQELYNTKRTQISSAAGNRNATVNEQRLKMEQDQLDLVRGIINSGATTPTAPPVAGGGGPSTGAASSIFVNPASANVLANQVAPLSAKPAPVNAFVNPPAGQTGTAPAANRADEITTQISRLAKVGGPVASQAIGDLVKEYNVINPEGEIKQDASGALVIVNRRTNVATPVLDKNNKPVMGDSKYESAYTSEVGKSQAARNEKVVTAAQSASANIAKIDQAIELLKKGDATTGLGAELRTNVDRARALFAGDIKAGKKVADTQILDALLGSDVFSMIQSLGIGARGLDTPAERDYLRQVMTGTIQMDNNALVRLSEIRRNIEVRAIEKYNTQLEKGELNKYFQTQGIKPEKIEVPKMAGSGNTVSVGGNTYTFPNAEAAAKFKKDAGIK
jgi:hypothetical protein